MAMVLAAFSVLTLYVETILQIYVVLTSHAISTLDVPIAMASLATTLAAFIITSVSSFVLTLRSSDFSSKTKVKLIFGGSHILGVGLLWRIFKLILRFTDRELKQLSMIRLLHVVLQSAPYVVLYSRFFIIGDKINVIQTLSLSASTCSAALALTSYNLRHKLGSDSWEEELRPDVRTRRAYGSLALTLVGTICVLATRLASMAVMAAQRHYWLAVPMGIHFVLMLFIFTLSAAHSTNTEQRRSCALTGFYVLRMSLLNTLDLVNDNIDRIMCKYVGFYTLLLVENIVLLSFWLLGSDLNYVTKLVTVLGILTVFVVGLVIKFIGCNMLHDLFFKLDEAPSLSTSGITTNNMTNTTTTTTTTEPGHLTRVDEDDLISIVQASVIAQSLRKLQTASHFIPGSNNTGAEYGLTQRTGGLERLEECHEMYSLQPDDSYVHNTTVSSYDHAGCQSFDISESIMSNPPRTADTKDHKAVNKKQRVQRQQGRYSHHVHQEFIEVNSRAANSAASNDISPRTFLTTTAADRMRTRAALNVIRDSDCYPVSSMDKNCHGYSAKQYVASGHSCHSSHTCCDKSTTNDCLRIPHIAPTLPSHESQVISRKSQIVLRQISYVLPEDGEKTDNGVPVRHNAEPVKEMSARKGRLNAIVKRSRSLGKAVKLTHRNDYPSRSATLPHVLRGNEIATVLKKQDLRAWALTPTAFHPTDYSGSSFVSTTVSSDIEYAQSSGSRTSPQSWWEDRQSSVSWPATRHHGHTASGRQTEHRTGVSHLRKGLFTLPRESSKISSAENILKWLDDTERCRKDMGELEHYTTC